MDPKKRYSLRNSTKSGVKTKKGLVKTKKKKKIKQKVFILKYTQIFMNSGVKLQNETVFIAKSTKKQFLLTTSGVIISILGVLGLELHSSSTEPVNFFGPQSSLGGHNSCLGGDQAVIWGKRPRNAPRDTGPDAVLSNTLVLVLVKVDCSFI